MYIRVDNRFYNIFIRWYWLSIEWIQSCYVREILRLSSVVSDTEVICVKNNNLCENFKIVKMACFAVRLKCREKISHHVISGDRENRSSEF